MNILSFFYPQVLEESVSPNSRKLEIKVVEELGKRRLEIGGMTQSGGVVEKIWKEAIKEWLNGYMAKWLNCLILGLGAGTVAEIIGSRFKIVGVEIDPEVIRLGKKYFGLGEIKNLKIVIGDAIKFVNQPFNHLTIQLFDLILVDLYQGREIPARCQNRKFLEGLRRLRRPACRQAGKKGLIIFNRLYSKDKKQETDRFVQKCREVFEWVETRKAICNLMVYCR